MKEIKKYLLKNFELVFVLIIPLSVIVITCFLPHKIAFLNFYYLPILVAGYFLGKKASVTGSILCILVVAIVALISPHSFYMTRDNMHLALHLTTWGSFLLLAGIIVGTLQEKLSEEYQHTNHLNEELQKSKKKLEKTNSELGASNRILEKKAKELEENKKTIESMKDKMEATLYSTMDSTVAKLVIQGRLRNEKKSIGILFSDLVGFTTFSEENKPEIVIEKLNKFLELMEPVIENYRGHIDKYTGDGIMCEFGAPVDYDNHALLAVLSGIKMQDKLHKSDLPWKMRIGIGSGPTITGMLGLKKRSYTAIGDVVNVASRLEKICKPGKIFIDEETYQAVKEFIDTERVRSLGRRRNEDQLIFERIKENEAILKIDPRDINVLFDTGKMHLELKEVTMALEYFEAALDLDPDNTEVKLLYADANFQKDKYEKIEIKGKKRRISVYEVIGIKDIMQDRKKIPEEFYKKYRQLEEQIEIPEDIMLPVEALDGTIGHSKMVAIISYAIADSLGLSEQEKKNILIAGFLEDIGKQIIPHYLLNRRGGLTETEVKEVEKHSLESTKILKLMGYDSKEILAIVVHHHEMYNGKGYPFKKKGEEIPMGARITGVADSYSALTSLRPYRDGWEQKAALDEIRKGAIEGKFDPQVSEALVKLMY